MQCFDRPTSLHELLGEIIEQFGMCRCFAAHAKIIFRSDDPRTKMMLPDAIHHYPRREWVIGTREPSRELAASASFFFGGEWIAPENL